MSAVSLTLVGEFAAEIRGRAYGIYNAIKSASYVLNPLIGGEIILNSNFAMIFVAAAAIGKVNG